MGQFSGDLEAILMEDLIEHALLGGNGRPEEVLRVAENIENYALAMLGDKDAWPLADEIRRV